jgi:hypothetical protein
VLGKYLMDGSSTVWFIQITDTHFTSDFLKYYPENNEWALGEAAAAVNPNFVVVTGDLTDSTNPFYGSGPHLVEWQAYRKAATDHGMTPDLFFDVPGNHDSYGDKTLSYYLQHSIQGAATGSTQQAWRIDLPGGALLFFSVATPANDGYQWPSDNKTFTTAELAEVDGFLHDSDDAEFKMCFGHHDYNGVGNASSLLYHFTQHGVTYYAHGHEHDLGVRIGTDEVVRFRMDSLGQSAGSNFTIWAVDNFCATAKVFNARSAWPLAIITAPADSKIQGSNNPHIPVVPRKCAQAPVRALAFGPGGVTSVSFRIDNGGWTAMEQRVSNTYQWRGLFNPGALGPGEHTVTVRVAAGGSRDVSNTFVVDQNVACDLGPEDPDGPDGGTPDAGFDAGFDGGTVVDAGPADAGHDAGLDGGTAVDAGPADAGFDAGADGGAAADSGSGPDSGVVVEDGGATIDAAEDDAGAVADSGGPDPDSGAVEDGGVVPPDSGLLADASVMPPADGSMDGMTGIPADQSLTGGCSCSAVGL